MHPNLNSAGRLWPLAVLALSLFVTASLHALPIDSNANGMSDIWELMYGVYGLDPSADADRDGAYNGQESVAGTNPFDSKSVPRITTSALVGTNFSVSLPCVLGKSYHLLSSPALRGAAWTDEGGFVARTGTVATLSAPLNGIRKYFRVVISDVDTDGDGLSDWEELQLGLDPFRASSSGQVDDIGQPLGDYRYATNRLAAQNVVSILASNPTATWPSEDPASDTGLFTITRGGFPLGSISVQLLVGGTAAELSDYAALPRPVIFPNGVDTVSTPVIPLAGSALKSGGIVTATLQPGSSYRVGSANSASVILSPNPTPAGTGLTGRYYNGSSTNYNSTSNFNPANLKVTRVDPTVDTSYAATSPAPGVNPDLFSVRWTGQVQPQYSENYTFYVLSDEGAKLWVNGQLLIDKWVIQPGVEWSGAISLQGGVRYDIQLDYFENIGNAGVHLSWSSPSQIKQIIPSTRLYPSAAPAPATVVSPNAAYAFLNYPFTYTIASSNPGTNPPTTYGASPLPPGLSMTNATNGIISGVPTLAGEFLIIITATNAVGVGASILDLFVFDTR